MQNKHLELQQERLFLAGKPASRIQKHPFPFLTCRQRLKRFCKAELTETNEMIWEAKRAFEDRNLWSLGKPGTAGQAMHILHGQHKLLS